MFFLNELLKFKTWMFNLSLTGLRKFLLLIHQLLRLVVCERRNNKLKYNTSEIIYNVNFTERFQWFNKLWYIFVLAFQVSSSEQRIRRKSESERSRFSGYKGLTEKRRDWVWLVKSRKFSHGELSDHVTVQYQWRNKIDWIKSGLIIVFISVL